MSVHKTARIGLESGLTSVIAHAQLAGPPFAKIAHKLLVLKQEAVQIRTHLEDDDDFVLAIEEAFGAEVSDVARGSL